MKRYIAILLIAALPMFAANAQHVRTQAADSMHMNMDSTMDMQGGDMSQNMTGMNMSAMASSFSRNLLMSRNGSGTSWQPDATPVYGYMMPSAKWSFMLHGNIFLRYNDQDFTHRGTRGNSKTDAPNWLMLMGNKNIAAGGLFHFSVMLSLDAVTMGGSGYPLLFQSGEAYHGKPLVDRQHPHDLFSELSVSYSYALSKKADLFLYAGYPGEPALGPVAFMHRASAQYNPDAPLSHHWVDATHITFGVSTLGLRIGLFKLEGSSFTGREPDDQRFNFDKARFDSWSSRLSFNPSASWALQVSHGFIKSPEALRPNENVSRTTASASYSLPLARNGSLNAIALWGSNKTAGQSTENAAMLEASFNKKKTTLYGRFEFVQKSIEELNLDQALYNQSLFPVNAATIGFNYDVATIRAVKLAAGTQGTMYSSAASLRPLYGKLPLAFEVYLRLYPGRMKM